MSSWLIPPFLRVPHTGRGAGGAIPQQRKAGTLGLKSMIKAQDIANADILRFFCIQFQYIREHLDILQRFYGE